MTMTTTRTHWHNIDILKGLLILLVFAGHIIPGAINETFSRYIINWFHMPLFIGISGFLQKESSFNCPFLDLLKKYLYRIILPWSIAVFAYYILLCLFGKIQLSVFSFIKAYLYPYYHLWFILGYLSYILICYVLYNIFKNFTGTWNLIMIFSLIISIVFNSNAFEYLFNADVSETIINYVQHDFRFKYLIFFTLGAYLRFLFDNNGKFPSLLRSKTCKIIAILSAAASVATFWWQNEIFKNIFSLHPISLYI